MVFGGQLVPMVDSKVHLVAEVVFRLEGSRIGAKRRTLQGLCLKGRALCDINLMNDRSRKPRLPKHKVVEKGQIRVKFKSTWAPYQVVNFPLTRHVGPYR
jgi:hypothetical protein